MKQIMRVFLFVPVLLILSVAVFAQGNVITLKQEHVAFVPKTYYIRAITDSLSDSLGIGTMTDDKKQKLMIQGGSGAAFKNFINNITQDKSKQAIVMNIDKIDIDIKKKDSIWVIQIAMSVSFYAEGIFLVKYTSSGHSETDADPKEYAEHFIRQTIEKNLGKFDSWWAENKNRFAVSETVKVNVVVAKTTNNLNWIVYSTRRPLQIRDFAGPVQDTAEEKATTLSGNTFLFTVETQKGQLVVNVTITPYFDKSQSWFKKDGVEDNKNAALLAHEQAHFDITAVKTCELVDAIRKSSFTKDNYISILNQLQKQYDQERNEEQDLYDKETNHSIIVDAQQAWQKRISLKVKALDCY